MEDVARSAFGRAERRSAPLVGWVCEWSRAAEPVVDFPGNELGPIPARTTVDRPAVLSERPSVLLMFDGGCSDRPIVVGVVRDPAAAAGDGASRVEVTADGTRVEVEGNDEIVLRCGRASITLRRNGRVVIQGDYVETRSKGTNRIKGGWVLIN